jgi:hypothetical protein
VRNLAKYNQNPTQNTSYSAATERVKLTQVAVVLTIAIVPTVLIAIVSTWTDIPTQHLMTDPLAILVEPFYLGLLSQLGIFIWASTGAISVFKASLLRGKPQERGFYQFFLATGIMAFFLGLDDIFMFHEDVFENYLGIPEEVTYALYAGFVSWYLWRFKGLIRRTDYTFLAIAFFSFVMSVVLDKIHPPFLDPYLSEDGFKFVGLVTWLAYVSQTAFSVFQRGQVASPGAKPKVWQ